MKCCKDSTAVCLGTLKNIISRISNKALYINMRVNKVIEIPDGKHK